jgi:hypothetical protein
VSSYFLFDEKDFIVATKNMTKAQAQHKGVCWASLLPAVNIEISTILSMLLAPCPAN